MIDRWQRVPCNAAAVGLGAERHRNRMRTLTEIRSSGRILQVAASAVVMLLALAALAPPAQVDGAWLDAASIAALLACAGGLMAVTIGAPGLASMLAIVDFSGGVAALDRYRRWASSTGRVPAMHPGC